jgi:hypothetical protein
MQGSLRSSLLFVVLNNKGEVMEKQTETTYAFIDLYDQVVNGQMVDCGFAYDSWTGKYQSQDYEKAVFLMKVRGYFTEE